MLKSEDIDRLYEKVLKNDMVHYNINSGAINFAIKCMQHVYRGKNSRINIERSQIADYRDPAHRCAYLYKYAVLHTLMVRDMLYDAVKENHNLFRKLVFSDKTFKICSLGGGPGTDIVGALAALHEVFGYMECSATVVDYMSEWSYSFDSIIRELGTGAYGSFGHVISRYLNWRYSGANLLKSLSNEVIEYLSTSLLVTMVKFTSAAACRDMYYMIKNIFSVMRPGATLFFIDNDGGGFHELIQDAAVEHNFISIFGPIRHKHYQMKRKLFKRNIFDYNACYETTVTVHVLQKPYIPDILMDPYMPENNFMPPRRPLLASPPTPFIYLGESPNINYNIPRTSPILSLPSPCVSHTPLMYHGQYRDENGNHATQYDVKRHNFSQDESIYYAPDFVTPIAPSPNLHGIPSHIATPLTANVLNSPLNTRIQPQICTPDTQPREGKRSRMRGCLPFNFRRHIANKLYKVKARATSVFKKKNKTKKIIQFLGFNFFL